MAKAGKSAGQPAKDQWELDQVLRQDLGLSRLGDGQELTDDDSFADLLAGQDTELTTRQT